MLGVFCQCSMLQGFQYAGGTVHGLKAIARGEGVGEGMCSGDPHDLP